MQIYQDKYIDFLLKTKGVSCNYIEVTAIHLKKLFNFLKEKKIEDISVIDRRHLDEFQQAILEIKYAPATRKHILGIANLFFSYLYDYGYIKEDIAPVIESPRKCHQLPRNIMNEEEIKFLLTLPSQKDLLGMRDICIINLLYSSAMRPKELFNLKLDDIDLKRNQAIIRRPKNRHDRIVHFDRYTAKHLRNYIQKVRPWLLHNKDSGNLFISATGSNLTSSSWAAYFSKKYKPMLDEKFKKNITPYSFRHTSATHWLDEGTKQKKDLLPYIQRQLGHESLESTAIYTHVAIEPLREMFKTYHPREIPLKYLHKIPSPEKLLSLWQKKNNPPH